MVLATTCPVPEGHCHKLQPAKRGPAGTLSRRELPRTLPTAGSAPPAVQHLLPMDPGRGLSPELLYVKKRGPPHQQLLLQLPGSCRTWEALPAGSDVAPVESPECQVCSLPSQIRINEGMTPAPVAPSPGRKAVKCVGHVWRSDALQVTQWHSLCSCTKASPVLPRQVAPA